MNGKLFNVKIIVLNFTT